MKYRVKWISKPEKIEISKCKALSLVNTSNVILAILNLANFRLPKVSLPNVRLSQAKQFKINSIFQFYLKRLFIFLFLAVIQISCISFPESNDNGVKQKNSDQVTVDQLKSQEQNQIKTKAILLEIKDNSELLSVDFLNSLRAQLVTKIQNKTTLVFIDNEDTFAEIKPIYQNNKWDANKLTLILDKKGIPIWIEATINSLKISGQTPSRGLVRKAESQIEVVTEFKMISSKNNQTLLHKKKTLIIEESRFRVSQTQTANQKLDHRDSRVLIENKILENFEMFYPDIQEALNKLKWEGRIALIQGDRIYLNVGQLTGLKIGDILKVTDMGEEIFDPQSGRLIGRTPGRLKGTIELVGFFGQDGSICVLHSGSGFRENDLVELYW